MKAWPAALALVALAPLPAAAAELVLGLPIAHDCYEQAERARDPRAGLRFCDEALSNSVLTAADRQATLVNRGILRARAHDQMGALEDYEAALAMNADDGEAYLNRSASLIALGRYRDAADDADKAIARNTARLEIAYYNRAVANEALGNIGAAYRDYTEALRIAPRFAAASMQLRRFRVVSDDAKGS
jgi:tetratricopeptide (TPR) repeat protein